MPSTKPYLIRAIYEWALENNLTPQILVTDSVDGVKLPKELINDGHIVFNIHEKAVSDLHLHNEWVMFSARFSGRAMQIEMPIEAVLAIYARENGQGIFFSDDVKTPPPEQTKKSKSIVKVPSSRPNQVNQGSHLKLVK